MTPYCVGLTGGLASGKSTVAGWLRDAGFEVVDADQLVAELYRPRAAGAAAARDLFGPSVLTPEGGVDHRALADHVFGDPEARRALENAIHPLVRRRFEEIVAGPPAAPAPALSVPRVVVLEATLLIEAGYAPGFDLVVTVEADSEVRLRRAVARGMREEAASARLAAQGDGDSRRRGAQRVLNNDGDLAGLRRQVDALIAEIAGLADSTHRAGSNQPTADAPDDAERRPADAAAPKPS